MKTLCVYCGAASGILPDYAQAARELATALVAQDIQLVYGGGRIGLMGILADEVLRLGGIAIGVIPQALMQKEVGHHGLSQLHIVANMHERKAKMAELADAFIALPGGFGTLEELFEALTWAQLDIHAKPVGLLNVANYYDGLLNFLKHTEQQGFLRSRHLNLFFQHDRAAPLLQMMQA